MAERGATRTLRVAYARGVSPGKWARVWAERYPGVLLELRLEAALTDASRQVAALHEGSAELAFVRLPVDSAGLHLIPLYEERPFVVAAKGHLIEAVGGPDDAVTSAELDDLLGADAGSVRHPFDDDIEATMQLVAANVGVVAVPQSIARLYARKDLIARPVADVPNWQIGLAWRRERPAAEPDRDDVQELIEDFVGVVRGRTANSSRGAAAAPEPPRPTKPAPSGPRRPSKPAPRGGRRRRRPTR